MNLSTLLLIVRRSSVAALGVALFVALPGWAVEPARVDDFEDGTTMGWTEGAPSPNPPVRESTAGPRGVGDAYLENASSGGVGPGSRMVTFNRSQWTGDYNSAGITGVTAHLINLGPELLPVRVAVEGAGGGRFASTMPAMLPADSTWYMVEFDLTPAAMTLVEGSQTLSSVLDEVVELRVLVSDSPDWSGDPVVSTMGIDNFASASVIFVDGFDSGDTSLWLAQAAADDIFTAVAQVPLAIPASGVLGNDQPPGHRPLSATLVSPPSNPDSSVVFDPDGSFIYLYDAPAAAPVVDSFSYRTDRAPDDVATVTLTAVPAPTLTDLRVSYRLDPWLIPGQWGSGFWVSPTTFGPVRQTGEVFILELRADAFNLGAPVHESASWIPEDPSVVTVSPSSGEYVTMKVWGTGESTLYVDSQGVRSTLEITATSFQGTAVEVVLLQP